MRKLSTAFSGCLILGFLAAPGFGAGFGIFEQGAKAMGLAGAFTAQADDASALFFNAGGLAFQTRREVMLGTALITVSQAEFRGPTGKGEQEQLREFPSHLYLVRPFNDRLNFGLGLNSPFGLETRWKDPDHWPGRAISTRASLRAYDLNPTVAWKANPDFGIGIGVVARFSRVQLSNRVQFPTPLGRVDVGSSHLEGGFDRGIGWNLGVLHKYNNSFQWGFSYRSRVKVNYDGEADLTQIFTGNTQLDALIASRLPFGTTLPVKTTIEFPDMASLGLLFAISPSMWLETDFNWTGWTTFDTVTVHFPGHQLPDRALTEHWDNAYNYRVGLRWDCARDPRAQWRLGYVYDQTPQPKESVNPRLPDANRSGFAFGWGRRSGNSNLDLALMYLPFSSRTTSNNRDNLNGTYKTTAWLLGASMSW